MVLNVLNKSVYISHILFQRIPHKNIEFIKVEKIYIINKYD